MWENKYEVCNYLEQVCTLYLNSTITNIKCVI